MKPHVSALVASLLLSAGAFATATTTPDGITSSDWNSILAAHETAKRAIVTNEDGTHSAFTPSQAWHVQFDGRGLSVSPDSADWQWGLRLQSYAFGEARTVSLDTPDSVSSKANRLTYRWDDTIQEWFVNSPNGLLQGWTIARLPEPADPSQLRLVLAVTGDLFPDVSDDAVTFNMTSGISALTYSGLRAWDADGRSIPVKFEKSQTGNREFALQIDASRARFPVTIDPIAQQAYLKASNTGTEDRFGFSVALSGDTAVIGALTERSNATGVNGNQQDNSLPDSGAAYVFVRNGSAWAQQAYLKASNTDNNCYFGTSVAISGNTIVVGAPKEKSNATGINSNQQNTDAPGSGAAYVFVRSGSIWSQEAYLKASNTGASDEFGNSVAISGDTIIVGAAKEDSNAIGVNGNQANGSAEDSGAAYVFVRNGSVWAQQAYLKASNTEVNDNFGYSVAISGNTVVVGAYNEDSNATGVNGNQANNTEQFSGAAYVFVRSGSGWFQQAYLKASNTTYNDWFGWSVAISGDTAVVGAINEDSSATGVNGNQADDSASQSGAAYVFVRSGSTWAQQAYLKASNTDAGDNFGISIAIAQNSLVIGAYGESSIALGVNGDQSNNSIDSAGAAYFFSRSGSIWTQEAYLKASNSNANDLFGYSVGISGTAILVGALLESSNAIGVNSPLFADNTAIRAGAAYAFLIPSPTLDARGKTRITTSRHRIVLSGTAADANLVEYKAGKGGFKKARGNASKWKVPLRLGKARTVVKIRATGPGGTSKILKIVINRK